MDDVTELLLFLPTLLLLFIGPGEVCASHEFTAWRAQQYELYGIGYGETMEHMQKRQHTGHIPHTFPFPPFALVALPRRSDKDCWALRLLLREICVVFL